MNIIYISLGVIVVALIGFFALIFSYVKIRNTAKDQAFYNRLTKEERNQFVEKLNKVTQNFNINTIMSIVTEFMYYTTECTVRVLTKLGIRKDITIDIDQAKDSVPVNMNLVVADGKNNMSTECIPCSYTEKYVDTVTNKVKYQKTYKKAYVVLELIRSDIKQEQKTKYCTNCGAPMELSGDFYDCPNCGTHYNMESFAWKVTNRYVLNDSANNRTTIAFLVPIAIMLLGSVVAELMDKFWLKAAVIGFDVLVAAGCFLFGMYLKKIMSGYVDLEKYDKNCSRKAFEKRAVYMLRLYEQAKDFELSKIKSFIEPTEYARLAQKNVYDDYYMLDFDVVKTVLTKFHIEGDYQIADICMTIKEISMNERKKVKCKKRNVEFSLYRHKDTLTTIRTDAEMITCECCGANINLTADGKCKYCGAPYDVSKYDWIIYKIND